MKIVFFDADCGFCTWCVAKIMSYDKREVLFFSPLEGEMAKKLLSAWKKNNPDVDSLVYVEDGFEPLFYSKAIFCILWQIGGIWTVFGLLSFLPRFFLLPFDFVYRIIAKNRKKACLISDIRKKTSFNYKKILP